MSVRDSGELRGSTRQSRDQFRMISCSLIGPLQIKRIGVAGEDLSRIFDRFERVETGSADRIAGTGLGLSIVREIASLHWGRLWAESELGLGSTFHLAIPASMSRVGTERRQDGQSVSRSVGES